MEMSERGCCTSGEDDDDDDDDDESGGSEEVVASVADSNTSLLPDSVGASCAGGVCDHRCAAPLATAGIAVEAASPAWMRNQRVR